MCVQRNICIYRYICRERCIIYILYIACSIIYSSYMFAQYHNICISSIFGYYLHVNLSRHTFCNKFTARANGYYALQLIIALIRYL